MDRSSVIYLLGIVWTENEYGVLESKMYKHKAYANVSSVTSTEYFNGGLNGLKPELRMTVFARDYRGEEVLAYRDKPYTIYRTYMANNDMIELYCELRKGKA